jgi:hypothetical protein
MLLSNNGYIFFTNFEKILFFNDEINKNLIFLLYIR